MKAVTYSAIRSFLNCKRKFYYQYIMRLRPKETPTYFTVGSAIHEALECWYRTRQSEKAESKINEYFKSRVPEPEAENYEEKYEEFTENYEISRRIFRRYIAHYVNEDQQIETIATEKEFIIDAKEIGINIDVKIMLKVDAIIKKNSIQYLMEHKTAASIDQLYKKKLSVDLQSMFYIMCINAIRYNIQGVCYNVISKKLPAVPALLKGGGLSTGKNRKPDITEYINAISDNGLNPADYEEYLDWLKENQTETFYREYIGYHDKQFEDLKNELGCIIKEMMDAEIKESCTGKNETNYYKNTSNCIGFGTCPFFDVCGALYPESVIESQFVQKEKTHEEYDKIEAPA